MCLEAAVRVEDALPERLLPFECSIGGPQQQEIPACSVDGVLPGGKRHVLPSIATLPNGEADQCEPTRPGVDFEDHLRVGKRS